MGKVTRKGLLAHKVRLLLTMLAIVLGVGFVAGTYVLTDTINKTFTDLFRQTTKGVDVAVRTNATFSMQGNEQRAPMPAAVRDQVARVPGVQAAEGSVVGYAQFVGRDGKAVATEFALPVPTLLAFVLLAGLAGMLAAIFPGRRAARIDMLRAITTE